MARRKRPPALVPRLGPPVNLRPGGAHGDPRRKTRSERLKAALRDEAAFDRFRGLAARSLPADNEGDG